MATNNDYTGKKQFHTRQVQKHDTEQNWITAGNNGFTPYQGEIIVYEVSSGPAKFKIGDGVNSINQLPFADSGLASEPIIIAVDLVYGGTAELQDGYDYATIRSLIDSGKTVILQGEVGNLLYWGTHNLYLSRITDGYLEFSGITDSVETFVDEEEMVEGFAHKYVHIINVIVSENECVFTEVELADRNHTHPIDSALSATSTNPVQNKVVNSAITNLNKLVGTKSVTEQINDAISSKIYVQDTEPTNVEAGVIWIDTSVSSVKSTEGVEF